MQQAFHICIEVKMQPDDFDFDVELNRFVETPASSYLGEAVLRLHAKRRSNERDFKGRPVYVGDWFFKPEFGNNCYEVRLITDESVRKVKEHLVSCLSQMVQQKKVVTIDVKTSRDLINTRQVNATIELLGNNGTLLVYQFFYEVL